MPRKTLPPLSPLQLAIMQLVWEHSEVTVGEIVELMSVTRPIARTTVQTTMVRLEEKGWLKHRQVANAFRYSAAVEREASMRNMLSNLVDKAFGGSVEGLLMTLLQERPPAADEVDRIRKLIEQSVNKGR